MVVAQQPQHQNDGEEETSSNPNLNYAVNHGPRPTIREVMACQFSSWYPIFSNIVPVVIDDDDDENDDDVNDEQQQEQVTPVRMNLRKNITIKSVIIQDVSTLAPLFRHYLLSDGVTLPHDATKLSSCAGYNNNNNRNYVVDNDSDSDFGNDKDDDKDEDENNTNTIDYSFPELNSKITSIIDDTFQNKAGCTYGVIPKLNWSAPRDATWINEGTMKCQTPGDIYLLLKSSDFITHDVVYQSLQDCSDYQYTNEVHDNNVNQFEFPPLELILRKWCHLNPSQEFRCFIRRQSILAISQRQHSVYYPHLQKEEYQEKVIELLEDFYEDYVRDRFTSSGVVGGGGVGSTTNACMDNYVMDVFIDQKDRVWLIDLNPWSTHTDSLLYDWLELTSMDDPDPLDTDQDRTLLRIANSEGEVKYDPLSSYRAPIDTVDLASMTNNGGGSDQGDDSKNQFAEFMKLCQQRPNYWEEDTDNSNSDNSDHDHDDNDNDKK